MRKMPSIKNQLKQLDDAIRTESYQFTDVLPSKVWRPWNPNIFRVCEEGIRVLDHTFKRFKIKHN